MVLGKTFDRVCGPNKELEVYLFPAMVKTTYWMHKDVKYNGHVMLEAVDGMEGLWECNVILKDGRHFIL